MKKIFFYVALISLFLGACSDESEELNINKKGVELTIQASIGNPSASRTSYVREASGMTVDWEATEDLLVVSFDESGITAVDHFTSTGEAGREKAAFSGEWNGKAGDKVICLYPYNSSMFSATVGNTSIAFTYAEHSPFKNIATLKNWDVMIGDVTMNGTDASVKLSRKTAVLDFAFSGGAYLYDDDYTYQIQKMGVSAYSGSNPVLFVNAGSIATTLSTYTGEIVASSYQPNNYRPNLDTQIDRSGIYHYYFPVVANGTLNTGDQIIFNYYVNERFPPASSEKHNSDITKTLKSSFTITPGKIYKVGEVGL